jgi:hypothetical protein
MSSRLLVLLGNVECKRKDREERKRAAPTALDVTDLLTPPSPGWAKSWRASGACLVGTGDFLSTPEIFAKIKTEPRQLD